MAESRIDTSVEPTSSTPEMHPTLTGVPLSMPEGMGRGFLKEQEEKDQQPLVETAKDTLDQSVAHSAYEFFVDSPEAIRSYLSEGSAELEEHRKELTAGVPLHLQDDIMASHTLLGAKSKRERIMRDTETQRRLARQVGLSSSAVQLASGMLDADLPLMFLSGGTLAAARTASTVARATKAVTGSTRMARATGDAAVGVSGGALSGAVVGGVGMATRDDMDAVGLYHSIIGAAVTGGVLNPAIGSVMVDKGLWTSAAKLEYTTALRGMERDLTKALNDPEAPINKATAPVNDVDRTPTGPVVFHEDSAGAASLGTAGNQVTTDQLGLKDVGAPDSIVDETVRMQNWKNDYDFDELYNSDTTDPIVKTLVGGMSYKVKIPMTDIEVDIGQIAGTVFTLGQRDFTNLVHSKAPSANFVAAEILESSSGLVRRGSSAAVLKEMFHGSSMVHSAEALVNSRASFFKARSISPFKAESHAQFARELRLAMHDKYTTGKTNPEFDELMAAVDKTHAEALGHMKGLSDEGSVRGARDIEHRSGYFRYDWSPRNFLKVRESVGEPAMIQAFTEAYQSGSGLSPDLAEKVAQAVVRRFSDRGLGVGAADARLLDVDSRSGIEAVLEYSGLDQSDIDSVMKRLDANTQERAKKGYLKQRVEADLHVSIPGTNLKLVDLMSDDFERSIQQYVGDAAGSAALANKGIRDQADLNKLRDTILYEQSALGEEALTAEYLDSVFSQFTGGAHKGYIMGQSTTGVTPAVSMLTKATRASLLQRVGLTQLMDTANIFVANGLSNSLEPVFTKLGLTRAVRSKTELANLYSELESLSVIVGQDHMLFRPHLSVDETSVANNAYTQMAQSGLNTVERATNYASGQIHVSAAQQYVAAAATSTNVIRSIAGDGTLTPRMLRDLGLTEDNVSELLSMIETGAIEVKGGNVKLNSKDWDDHLKQDFGSAMVRAVNQQVQKGLVGETSVWMNSDIGKILSSLKTFAMTAVQKQAARQLMIGGKSHFLGAAAWQLGFAYMVLSLSQQVQGTEMSAVDRARLAVAYTPTLGTVPMVTDPITTMLGFDDLNFSPYGRYASYLDTPVFDQTSKLIRSPGAIKDMLTGDGDYDDMQNAKAMFMLNWYGMKQIWENM